MKETTLMNSWTTSKVISHSVETFSWTNFFLYTTKVTLPPRHQFSEINRGMAVMNYCTFQVGPWSFATTFLALGPLMLSSVDNLVQCFHNFSSDQLTWTVDSSSYHDKVRDGEHVLYYTTFPCYFYVTASSKKNITLSDLIGDLS